MVIKKRPPYPNLELVKDLWFFIKIHKKGFIFYTILLIISSLISLLPAIILAKIIDFFIGGGTDITIFYKYLGGLLLIMVFNDFLRLGTKHQLMSYTIDIQQYLKVNSFNKLLELDLIWHEKINTGNKIEKIEGGRSAIGNFADLYINQGIQTISSMIGIIIIFFIFGPKYALVAILFIITYLFVEFKLNKKLAEKTLISAIAKEKSSGKTYEFSSNISTIKFMGIENSSQKQVLEAEEKLTLAKNEKRKTSTIKWIHIQTVSTLFYVLFIFMVGKDVLSGVLTVGVIVIYVQYVQQLVNSLNNISRNSNTFLEIKYGIYRLMQLYKEIPEINEENAKDLKNWDMIKMKDLKFRYKEGEVLENFSLDIKRGEKIGIVGKTGSGKSTLFKILLKLYLPSKGMIYFDNKPVTEIKRNSIIQKIAIVPQETEVFNLSLKDNVKISSERTNLEKYKKAIIVSQLFPVISKLKNKDKSLIGEKGIRLSGGERQRLGIARAIYKDSDMIIFDESTSNLDYETEKKIQEGLDKLNKTLLISAHRLSTLKNMDKIVFLEQGKIVEQGTYQELLRKKGKFYKLWKEQGGWKE